eukprot:3822262-Rhodomonas_salina.1
MIIMLCPGLGCHFVCFWNHDLGGFKVSAREGDVQSAAKSLPGTLQRLKAKRHRRRGRALMIQSLYAESNARC